MGNEKGQMTIAHVTSTGIAYCASVISASLTFWWYKMTCGCCRKSMDFAPSGVEYFKVT